MVNGLLAGAAGGATVSIVIRAVDKFSGTLTQAQKSMAKVGAAVTAVGIAGAAAVSGLVKMAGQFEQTQIAFTTMLGSATEANKLLKDLADFAARTPFTIPGIEKNAKLLLGMGVAADDMIPTLKVLGDVSAGLSVPLDRIALNFGQIRVQGKLTGRELRDFAVAGVPLVAELAKNFNLAEKEIAAMVSRGEIGFKDVEEAFFTMTGEGGKFFDLMDAQSKTFLGQVSNIQDSFIKLARIMGELFLPAASFVADKLAILVGWFEQHPTIATVAAVLLAVATALALIVGPILILVAMLPLIIAGFATLSAVTLPMTLAIAGITAAVIALIAAGVFLIKEWDNVKIAIAEIWNTIVESIGKGVNAVIRAINFIIKQFNKLARKFGKKEISLFGSFSIESGLINIDAMKKLSEESNKVTKEVEKTNKALTREQELVNKLSGFKVIQKTGDIFNPLAFSKSEFESKFAFEQAKRGAGVEINIENVNGLDPEEIAAAIQSQLRNATTL